MSDQDDDRTRAPPPMQHFSALPAGTRLDGRYVVRSVIAAGGFGITYLAEHKALGTTFAVKEHFPRQFAFRETATSHVRPSDPQVFHWALDRFLQEGRALARSRHPNVVRVSNVFEENSTAYMVLEYEEGQSLRRWLDDQGRPPTQAELDAIVEPLLAALEFVHAQGLLHRDIAPDNIIIRPDGKPCLIDFGAARFAIAQRSHVLSAIVKPGYSPPEQYAMSGRAQGPWSDIYALGATLYRCVSGAAPPEALDRIEDDRYVALSTAARDASLYRPEFLAGIDAALSRLTKDRPKSISAWRRMLLPHLAVRAPATAMTPRRRVTSDAGSVAPSRKSTRHQAVPAAPSSKLRASVGQPAATAPPSRRGSLIIVAGLLAILAAAGIAYALVSARLSEPAPGPAPVVSAPVVSPAETAHQPVPSSEAKAIEAPWPTRAVTLVVPFAAGGATDVTARQFAEALGGALGQPFHVENVPGAGGTVGTARVANGAADGSQFVVGTLATHVLSPALLSKAGFDPIADFAPVGLLLETPLVLAVADGENASFAAFLARAKSTPGGLKFSSNGIGSVASLGCFLLNARLGINGVHVPFRTISDSLASLTAGDVDYTCDAADVFGALVTGKLKLLAVLGSQRLPNQTAVPTIAELGYPGAEAANWTAIFAPKATPANIIRKLNEAIGEALASAHVQSALFDRGLTPPSPDRLTPHHLEQLLRSDAQRWGEVISRSGARP